MMKALLVVAFYFADFAADLAESVFAMLTDLSDWLDDKLMELEDKKMKFPEIQDFDRI